MKSSIAWLARLSGIVLLLALAQGLRADTVYNVVTQFSTASNPNGVWSYLANGTLYSSSEAFSDLVSGLPGWSTNGGVPNDQFMAANNTASPVTYGTVTLPAGDLTMDPESGSVAIDFTAPSAGTYAIAGNFLGIDSAEGTHPVEILDDGTVIWSGTISSDGQDDLFDLSEALKAGDVISFYVGTGSAPNPNTACDAASTDLNYCDLGTGLDATVTLPSSSVPEPSTLPLLAAGLFGLILVSGRQRMFGRRTQA